MYTALILSVLAVGSLVGYFAANSGAQLTPQGDVTDTPVVYNFSAFAMNQPPPFTRRSAELKLVPTAGEAWPKPRIESKLNYYYNVSSRYSIKITNYNCKILVAAVNRYAKDLKIMYNMAQHKPGKREKGETGPWDLPSGPEYQGLFLNFKINLTNPCEYHPYPGMDESYTLTVTSTSMLTSGSVWGLLRGLETALHLFYFSDNEVRINATSIIDYPAYPHRGFMLDTARHYVSVETILKTLNAMSMNKMNVFHWHIVGNESFPFESQTYPELSEKGTIHPSMVYSIANIRKVIEYGRVRGIIVYPEINVPANAYSWARSHPELTLQCVNPGTDVTSYILNPLTSGTYKLLWNLLREFGQLFPYDYIHLGSEGVDLNCLASTDAVSAVVNNRSSVHQLYENFSKRIITYVIKTKKLVVWQDIFDKKIRLPKDVIIQVYNTGWIEEMINVVRSGRSVILSAPWDLEASYMSYLEQSFAYYYSQHPREMVRDLVEDEQLQLVLGGEVCMWTHFTSDDNVITTAWPRTAAAAEALWSVRADPGRPSAHTLRRAWEQARRMRRRGIIVGKFV